MSGLPDIGNSMSKSATADLDGGESGIHNPGAGDMDSGLAPLARPGMTAALYRPTAHQSRRNPFTISPGGGFRLLI
jgi:hypothetical protein